MGTEALDAWNDEYGSLDDYTKRTQQGGRYEFEFRKNYKVRITRAQIGKSSRGDVQVAMDLAVLNGDGEPVATHKEWLTLPMQASDRELTGGPKQVVKITLRRRDDLQRILSRVDPAEFALYASVGDAPGGRSKYFDADGNEMSGEAMDERQVAINRRVMMVAADLHERVGEDLEDWRDAEFYIVKQPNKNNERYPYTNFYARPNPKLETWEGDDDVAA